MSEIGGQMSGIGIQKGIPVGAGFHARPKQNTTQNRNHPNCPNHNNRNINHPSRRNIKHSIR